MSIFINGTGNISPQKTFDADSFLKDVMVPRGARLTCIEPDYTGWIDPKAIRRMSRIIRMGVASGLLALKQAGIQQPDAIITGTGYGCLEDTGLFLSKMIANNEQALNPTPFIQSTHNTIGSQIALGLQCMAYNQTYAHKAFSLESALLDAIMLLDENNDMNVLIGGVDEVTGISHDIFRRFGFFRHDAKQGEGAAYFLLAKREGQNAYARVRDLGMLYKPDGFQEVKDTILGFLGKQSMGTADIDLVLFGNCGDSRFDGTGSLVLEDLFLQTAVGSYKHLCGEFPTATGFAVWLGACILKKQIIPEAVGAKHSGPIKNILICNPYFGTHLSLILLAAC